LPPTIKCSNREVQTELGKTLFERLMRAYDSDKNMASCKPSKMLKVQYRMHEDIADWASVAMYNGKLISHDSVKHRKLDTLPQVQEKNRDRQPNKDDGEDVSSLLQNITLTMIDTTGCGFNENTTDAGSRYNEGEADLVVSHVQSLLALGLRAEDIAVITP
jgi:superfamily I DNA and/or RNA helicase